MKIADLYSFDETVNVSLDDRHQFYLTFAKAREIQSRALTQSRWTALITSLVAWLLLLFGGAAIFQACEREYQNWTYFNGLYMAFISLTTIGYGDLTPTSNSGRSFFVFWSLLAVPTITILISNAEDTLLRVFQEVTLFLGSITILPETTTLGKKLKSMLLKLDYASNSQKQKQEASPESGNGNERLRMMVPATRSAYCAMLVDEMLHVSHHLNTQPLRFYTFDEWVWFAKLFQGYENLTETCHRTMEERGESSKQGELNGFSTSMNSTVCSSHGPATLTTTTNRGEQRQLKLGHFTTTSPLMGPKEEADWILRKLAATLQGELEVMTGQDEHLITIPRRGLLSYVSHREGHDIWY